MEKKKIGLMGLAVLIGAGLLVLFELIGMINTYSNGGRIFWVTPLGDFLILTLWALIALLFLFRGKTLLAAAMIGLGYLVDRGLTFVTDLLGNTLDFTNAAGFGSLLLFAALIFMGVAFIIERDKLERPQFACPIETPYITLFLTFIIFTLIFDGAVNGVFMVVLLLLVVSYNEEKSIPLVIATLTMANFFNLIDLFIGMANDLRANSLWWFNFILGTLVFAFAVVSYFIPDPVNKGVNKIKEKVSHPKTVKEENIVEVEVVEEKE